MGDEMPQSYSLEWSYGCPEEPGTYLFRMPKEHDLQGIELVMRMLDCDAHDWHVVTLVRDPESGRLEYTHPRDGLVRSASGEFGNIHVWWARIQDNPSASSPVSS